MGRLSQHYWRERTSYHRRTALVRKKLGQMVQAGMVQAGSAGAILIPPGTERRSRDRHSIVLLALRGGVLTLVGIWPSLFRHPSLYRMPHWKDDLSRGSVFW